jgi:UDP-2,3-diacylglucosamine hydrolase
MPVEKPKKIYFISDVHLGLPPREDSLKREKLLVSWLNEIRKDAEELYLMGDIFDFWHEYRHVVPKGFTRFLGKLAELADGGTKLYFFSGNHDIWAYDYFRTELGAEIYHKPIIREIRGSKFFLAHGDGLGPGDFGYKLLKWTFRNKFHQFLFARIHPNFALWLGKLWSKNSRYSKGIGTEVYLGSDKELQMIFARQRILAEHFDYFIFGHRHIALDIQIAKNTRVINLGDWINNFTYAEFDGKELSLLQYQGEGRNIIVERIHNNHP